MKDDNMIVLLTDFGESEYVGVMKGVILGMDKTANVVDLTHSITPECVREAAWVLLKSYRYFPKHSVFVCVIDPGVGTARDAVLVTTPDYVFIGPDNGLLSPTLEEVPEKQIYSIHIDASVSNTFHGRDVFAVAAGQYCSGKPAQKIGVLKQALEVPLSFNLEGGTGEVVRVDRFGNIITNIPPTESAILQVIHGSRNATLPLSRTYADGPSSGLFVLVSSYDTLEIAMQNRRAIDHFPVEIGDRISIQ